MMAIDELRTLPPAIRLTELRAIKVLVVVGEIVVMGRDGGRFSTPATSAAAKRVADGLRGCAFDADDEFKELLATESEAA